MKRLVLAALFGVSFALHSWSHASVAEAPQHELCAVSVTAVQTPEPPPAVVVLSQEPLELPDAAPAAARPAARAAAAARAPPAFLPA